MKPEVKLVNENLAPARVGEVVLYKRGNSARWHSNNTFHLKQSLGVRK
jgi:hypothetical protein